MSFSLSPDFRKASVIPQKTIAAASIGASYTLVEETFGQGVVNLIIVSTLDTAVQLSLDGTTDFIAINPGVTYEFNLKNNRIALSGEMGVYVKEIGNPTTGSLYVGGFGVQ